MQKKTFSVDFYVKKLKLTYMVKITAWQLRGNWNTLGFSMKINFC